MTIRLQDNERAALISAAQNLTGTWADLGEVIDVRDVDSLGLWLDLDINDSENARFRILALSSETDSSPYSLPIRAVGFSDVKLEEEYFEFNVDQDQKMLVEIEVSDLIQYIKVQVKAGTVGASAGQIDSAYISGKTIGR